MEEQSKNNIKLKKPESEETKKFTLASASPSTESYKYTHSLDSDYNLINDINLEEVKSVDKNNEEIISEVVVKEKLEEVAQKVSPKKRKKSIVINILMLVINITLVALLASSLFRSAEDASIANLIAVQGNRLNYLWYALLLFVIVMIADMLFIASTLKASTGKFRFWLAYRTSSIGKYYEAITPLSAGGQPAQILYMAKRNVSPGVATSVPIIRVSILNLLTILLSLILFIFVVPKIEAPNSFLAILYGILKILAYIGVIFNSLYLAVMLIIASSKTLGRSLARNVVKLGYKLHLIKDYRTSYKKFMNQVAEYQNSIRYLKKHIWLLLSTLFTVLVEIIALASVPFVVCLAIGDITFASSADVWRFYIECLAKYYICYMASAYIPLPGGTGMMEISFVILFTSAIGSNFVVWGFLIWRLVSYYVVILQGFIQTIGDFIAGTIKKDKVLKS